MKMFYEKDTDANLIKDKKIAIFGYGSQGHAHALNLKDSGVKEVVVALREGSSSIEKAESKGLKVMNLSDAAEWADVIMMLNGALAGLVAITAEPLTPSPMAAMIIGSIGAVIMYFGTKMLENYGLDDVVGAIPVHMFAGIFGTLVVPFTNGDTSFATQFTGVLSVCVFSFVLSLGVFKALSATTGLRISKEAEKLGTDKAEIGVVAYAIRD